jgi:hypothetical protein
MPHWIYGAPMPALLLNQKQAAFTANLHKVVMDLHFRGQGL